MLKIVNILKSLIIIIICYAFFMLIAVGISYYFKFNLKDVQFVIGLLLLIMLIFSNISGNSMGLSLQALGDINSQYVANVNLEACKKDENNERAVFKLQPNKISTLLFIISILFLITSYFY
jgi:hypothetical protein